MNNSPSCGNYEKPPSPSIKIIVELSRLRQVLHSETSGMLFRKNYFSSFPELGICLVEILPPVIYRCLKWAFLIPLEMWKRPLEGFWLRIKEIFLWEYAVKFWGSALRSYPLCISWGKYRKFLKFIGRDSWWKGHWSMIFCKSFSSASLKPAIHSNTSRKNWFVVFVEVGIHCLKYYLRILTILSQVIA